MGLPQGFVTLSAADYPVTAAVSVITAGSYSFGTAQQSAFVTGLATDMGLKESQIRLSEPTQYSTNPTRHLRRRQLLAVVLTVPFQISGTGQNSSAALDIADRLPAVALPGSWLALRLSAAGVPVQSIRVGDAPVVSLVAAVSVVIPFQRADPSSADNALSVRG